MDANKREIRTIECQLAIREAAQDAQGESRTISGTAIVFNKESVVLDDWGEKFREVILPEAVTMAFLNSQDIKMNLLHERELSIARANKGNGGLRLSVDGLGVHFEFEAPRCDLGDRALELIRTGVYSGCSFEFYPQDYDVEERGDEVIIKHRKFAALTALTIGMDPAYRQTTVNARELAHREDKPEDEKPEDEKPEDEKPEDVNDDDLQVQKEREAMEYAHRRRLLEIENIY